MRLPWSGRAADLSIFHEFVRPPYGGGNQFLLALRGELRRRGLRIESNRISKETRACLFNSFNFDFDQLRQEVRRGCRMVHRVDGPIGRYRGEGPSVDERIMAINRELADATVFLSNYSLNEHRALGLEFRSPTVIMNAPDPSIFYPAPGQTFAPSARKVRIISTAWSDNPNKGQATFQWLDEHLDHSRYDYTFIGRVQALFRNIRQLAPLPSAPLADALRSHDIYLTASLLDPCSNALIEALSCGLPAIYARSGGHPEIVGEAGLGFDSPEEIPGLLDQLVAEHATRRAAIALAPLPAVADRYLEILGISGPVSDGC